MCECERALSLTVYLCICRLDATLAQSRMLRVIGMVVVPDDEDSDPEIHRSSEDSDTDDPKIKVEDSDAEDAEENRNLKPTRPSVVSCILLSDLRYIIRHVKRDFWGGMCTKRLVKTLQRVRRALKHAEDTGDELARAIDEFMKIKRVRKIANLVRELDKVGEMPLSEISVDSLHIKLKFNQQGVDTLDMSFDKDLFDDFVLDLAARNVYQEAGRFYGPYIRSCIKSGNYYI